MTAIFDSIGKRQLNPKQKKVVKDSIKRASAIASAQTLAGPGLYVDTYLRNFLHEYNTRLLKGEGMNMPLSINVLHAMLEPDEKAMVLKMLPEDINTVSFIRLLEHATDPSSDTSLKSFAQKIDELKVYEINMLGGYEEFKIPGAEDYVFAA